MGSALSDERRSAGYGPRLLSWDRPQRSSPADCRRTAHDRGGADPIVARQTAQRKTKPIPTFGEIAALVVADAQAKTGNAKVKYQWERHLGPAYSGPLLDRPVNEITTIEVAAVLRPIWRTKPEVARKTYPAIRRVFDRVRVILRDEHGVTMNRNPAEWSDLKALGFEAPRQLSRGRHPSLPYDQLPEFMAQLHRRNTVTATALEFLILTNVRTDAVLKATWDQFDLGSAVWTVPLANLKDRDHRTEPFRVPLSPARRRDCLRNGEGAPFSLRFPRHGRRAAAIEYGAPHAPEAHELWRLQMARQRRPTDYGAWLQGDVSNVGGGSRHRPARCR